MFFSLSHTNSYAAAMLHPTAPVGIDVEQVSERVLRIRKKFLSETEESILQSFGSRFAHLSMTAIYTLAWSAKEAAYKALHQSGIDFINDLPIVLIDAPVDAASNEYTINLGGKGQDLLVRGWVMSTICLAVGVEGRG